MLNLCLALLIRLMLMRILRRQFIIFACENSHTALLLMDWDFFLVLEFILVDVRPEPRAAEPYLTRNRSDK